jgi:hypothetical protein
MPTLLVGGLLGGPLVTGGLSSAASAVLEPADSLLTAIWRFADADDALETAFGRAGWLWKNKAPRGVSLPYAVVFEVGSAATGIGSGETYHEDVAIQFNIFATSEVAAKRLGGMISDAFAPYHGQQPVVFEDGEDLDRWIGDGNILERDFARGRGGAAVYVQRINYSWRIGRSYVPA